MTQIGDKITDNEDGIKELLAFLDNIYDKDEMADVWDKLILLHFLENLNRT